MLKNLKIAIFVLSMSLVSSWTIADEAVLPLCSQAVVVLNPGIPCRLDLNPPTEFNIPELELNFDNLDQIFMGAESSGGRVISPLGTDNNRRQSINGVVFNRDFNLKCHARLVLDGGKAVSYLSLQNFKLSNQSTQKKLQSIGWTHFVMKGNNPFPSKKYSVPSAPKQNINNFNIKVHKNQFNKKTVLQVCEEFSIKGGAISKVSCAEIEKPHYSYKFQVTLKSLKTDQKKKITITKSLLITCTK